jgi:hypothetical protein
LKAMRSEGSKHEQKKKKASTKSKQRRARDK